MLEHIRSHLHDPHWREVLLLLIAQQKRGNPAKCLTEILNFPDPYEPWLHRNLFFAAACLAEDIPVADETLVAKILDELVALETSDAPSVSWKVKQQVFKTFSSLYETEFEQPALQRLLNAPAGKIDRVRLQVYRAALGQEEDAITALLSLLQDAESDVRSSAADALGKLGNASDAVVTGLLSLLQDAEYYVRSSAADALGQLGKTNEEARIDGRLRDWLEQNPEAGGAGNAVDALWTLVVGEA